MHILLRYFLLSVLLRTGATFQCGTCQKDGASTCTPIVQACNTGEHSCLSRLNIDITGDKKHTKIEMGCAPPSLCNAQLIHLALGKGIYMTKVSHCCETDGCTPPSPSEPSLNTTYNGKYCPVCFSERDPCSDKAVLNCTGSATYCFDFTILNATTHKERHIKGCATKTVCNTLKEYKGPLIGPSEIHNVNCQEAKSNSSCLSLEFFLLGLLLVKTFLFSAY